MARDNAQQISNKKVLIVCGQDFLSDNKDGGRRCGFRNYELLKHKYGEDNVHVCFFSNAPREYKEKNVVLLPAHHNVLTKAIETLKGNFFYDQRTEKEIIKYISEEKIETVFFERTLFANLSKKLKKQGIHIQVFMENIESDYFHNKVMYQNRLLFPVYLSVKKCEKEMLNWVDDVFVLTEKDKMQLNECYGKCAKMVIPMTFTDVFIEKKQAEIDPYIVPEKTLMFIGSLFPPNYNGIKWFIDEVMKELTEFNLIIVGKSFEEKKQELERENVSVIGTVDDLAPYYFSDSVMVMPILFGDGMKIKTAESMMYGKIIFATSVALEGYEIKGIEGIYECNTKDEFVNNIRLSYPQQNSDFYSQSVRTNFLENYESSRMFQNFADNL